MVLILLTLVYSACNASIGDSRMAFRAGYNPKQMPSTAEKETAINIQSGENTAGHAGTILTILTARCAIPLPAKIPSPTPSNPPILHTLTDSLKNCSRISEFLAPSALHKPISRVRSPTATNIMFIIPMPPTRSENPAILPNPIFRTVLIFKRLSNLPRTSKMRKKSSSFRWRLRITALTSSMALGTASMVDT